MKRYSHDAARLIAGQADARTLRKELSPATVLFRWGKRQPLRESGLRLHYTNPFRNDENPSLDVYIDRHTGEYRCGDMAEGWNGSCIDLEQRFTGESNSGAIEACRDHYAWQLEHGLEHTVTERSTGKFLWKPPEHNRTAADAWHLAMSREKPCLPPLGFLRDQFDIVIGRNETVWAPSFEGDEVVAYMRLSRSDGKKAGLNSKTIRYTSHDHERRLREDDHCPVIIVEGHSDTWVMAWMYGHEYAVIGFPGANQDPTTMLEGINILNRTFVLAFDGDVAGREARHALAERLSNQGGNVQILPMYEGRDCADLHEDELTELMDNWKVPYNASVAVIELDGQYFRLGRSGNPGLMVTNWALNIDRLYISDQPGVYAYTGTLLGNDRRFKLMSSDLSMLKFREWCMKHNVAWFGNSGDIEKMTEFLRQEAMFAPVARMATRAGLHQGAFVWPNEVIGRGEWTYIPPDVGVDLSPQLEMAVKPKRPELTQTMKKLVALNDDLITVPVLSWLATAPLRPLFERYPFLHVSGVSGSGKTTMMHVMTYIFSGSTAFHQTLTSTTPYGIAMMFESVNNMPIWFDEYRNGARTDSKMFLDQMLRDAYAGQVSVRGDVSTKGQRIQHIRTDVPIIVSGEDTLIEKSHLDRAIPLHLMTKAQDPEALKHFDFAAPITRSYLEWLVRSGKTRDMIETKPIEFTYQTRLNDRQLRNLWVLDFGHRLLSEWLEDEGVKWEIPPISWEQFIHYTEMEEHNNPLVALIEWALDVGEKSACWQDGAFIYIHPFEFMRVVQSPSGPKTTLPFTNHRGLQMHLMDQMDGQAVKKTMLYQQHDERQANVIQIPLDALDSAL